MQDFNEYANNPENFNERGTNGDLFRTVSDLAKKFDGKHGNDLRRAAYAQAERGKKNRTLSNAELDKFAATLSPLLDEKKRALLKKVVADLKKI